ncbi:MAG: AI-2E family transporter [Candidatus Cybelea sp.]|jgi:predicted PurR-regulated permease PerM
MMQRPGSESESQAVILVAITARTWVTGIALLAGAYLIWLTAAGALSALVLLFTGILVAVALRPIIDRLRVRMPFGAAVGAAFGAMVLIVALIAWVAIAPLGAELQRLFQAFPGYLNTLKGELATIERYVNNDRLSKQVAGSLANSAGGIVNSLGVQIVGSSTALVAFAGNAVIILLLAVGWALSCDQLESFVLRLFAPSSRQDWKQAVDAIGGRLSAYAQGVVINGAIVGVTMGVSLALLRVPYALLLGFVVAVLQAIPMVGAVISGVIVLFVVLATSGWVKMAIALAIFIVVQAVDQNVISPIIFGQRVQLSFLLIIFATVAGSMLLGIPGAFLAVPAAAVLQVIVVRIIAPAVRRATGADPQAPSSPA